MLPCGRSARSDLLRNPLTPRILEESRSFFFFFLYYIYAAHCSLPFVDNLFPSYRPLHGPGPHASDGDTPLRFFAIAGGADVDEHRRSIRRCLSEAWSLSDTGPIKLCRGVGVHGAAGGRLDSEVDTGPCNSCHNKYAQEIGIKISIFCSCH